MKSKKQQLRSPNTTVLHRHRSTEHANICVLDTTVASAKSTKIQVATDWEPKETKRHTFRHSNKFSRFTNLHSSNGEPKLETETLLVAHHTVAERMNISHRTSSAQPKRRNKMTVEYLRPYTTVGRYLSPCHPKPHPPQLPQNPPHTQPGVWTRKRFPNERGKQVRHTIWIQVTYPTGRMQCASVPHICLIQNSKLKRSEIVETPFHFSSRSTS